jgi:hypothetical protein
MDNPTSATKVESGKTNLRLKVLLEKLRTKLRDFTVVDRLGHQIGQVKDAKLDSDRSLNLVIYQQDSSQGDRFFLLRSNYIQRLDSSAKSLVVDISKAEIDQLPEYVPTKQRVAASQQPSSPEMLNPGMFDENAIRQNINSPASSMPVIGEHEDIHDESEIDDAIDFDETSEVVTEEVIRLLEERLVIGTTKRKVGEVIVRKQIETRMVQVPVRYEKLIIEQVSPEYKHLSEIELGHGEVSGLDVTEVVREESQPIASRDKGLTVSGEFPSAKAASHLLDAIAMQRRHGCKKVRIEIVLENDEHLKTYQEWFDRCSGK